MPELEIYEALARYNHWMNERLLEVCAALPDEQRKRDVSAPFRSIHGTWNHILLADKVWLGRFTGSPVRFASLAEELYSDFDELRLERAQTDAEIEAWVASLTGESLAAPFTYVSMINPRPFTMPLYLCATHFFNHQTHHRGQLTTLLEQLGVDFGVTDLIAMPGVAL